MANSNTKYDYLITEYEGENGGVWAQYLSDHENRGWQLRAAEVTKRIDDKRFVGKVTFRKLASK